MRIEVAPCRLDDLRAQTLAVPAPEGAPARAAGLDGAVARRLASAAEGGELRADPGEALVFRELAPRLIAAGVGGGDADELRTGAATVARAQARLGGTVAWALDPELTLSLAEQARAVVEGIVLGGYDPGRWRSVDPEPALEGVVLLTDAEADRVQASAERAAVVAGWTNRSRDLANAPANELTPAALAEHAAEFTREVEHLTVEALDPAAIAELGMGALGAVAAGSHNPARLIVMRYDPPAAAGDVVLGLVGKAITFDTGGVSLKPALRMEDMKGDMAGGGSVVAAMGALAALGIPLRAIAVVAATENMVGGGAYRPGDILRAANGKTIEITNTDAEGRLVLADALWYARREGATHIVDFATLTGAMDRALGDLYAGVFGTPDEWRDAVVAAGEASGDHAWPLPLHRRYRRHVDSDFADMKNSSSRGQAAPAYAAEFLKEFAGEGPWAHVDMAGTGFLTWSRGDYLWQRGGTGYGVRLMVELAQRLAGPDSGLAVGPGDLGGGSRPDAAGGRS